MPVAELAEHPPRANGNSIPNSFWMLAEVIRDPQLYQQVCSIIAEHRIPSPQGTPKFDFAKICSHPLLQSVYAETMRTHTAVFVMRGPNRKDFNLRGWRIPRDAIMMISSYDAQTDPEVWATNPDDVPADQFWAERFLTSRTTTNGKVVTEFSLKGRGGNWIPYGGGQRMCPGRHFAKQEMISSCAIMLSLFDIELAGEGREIPNNDLLGYGFGAMWPKGAMPVRMRRRIDL